MRARLIEHMLGIILVTLLIIGALLLFEHRATAVHERQYAGIKDLLDAPISKINDPFERALLADCMDLYYPGRHDTNAVLISELIRFREDAFNKSMQSSYRTKRLSIATFREIAGMYLKFLLMYLIVMALTYYGVETLGSLRFIFKQQRRQQHDLLGRPRAPLFIRAVQTAGKTIAYAVLFSPAYVIAYSIRTEFNTDSAFFMILLGVISNGLLIMYMNKFYAFLVAESRKGYVENALVKNLRSDYTLSGPDGISLRSVFNPAKRFSGHVFDHIFRNARFQYLSTIKEQASFLITGLVIIEMALNIHGHLTYELLRQLLYKNYPLVVVIMLAIFYTVKLTEITTDLLVHRESRRYENR
ncbi:MAG: hypothetical protein JW913_13885 [Chitinispirillaceae bacterium]|nr:hypothetical protein [Chitinispirillaceae bacterium]